MIPHLTPQHQADLLPPVGYVRLPVILKIFPVSASAWWQGIKDGRYPKGVKLAPRTTAWKVEDIRALLARTG